MLLYRSYLKHKARKLRGNMTDSEQALWSRLRGRHLLDVQFFRQRPIGDYIVDFYAPKAKLVIEVDGSQHREKNMSQRDRLRDDYMKSLGLRVLRFNSNDVLERTDSVMEVIYRTMVRLLNL